LLSDENREFFHTMVANLLYLADRVKPNVLLISLFLPTRVRCPTEQDMSKLKQFSKYLNGTKTLGLSMKGETLCLRLYS